MRKKICLFLPLLFSSCSIAFDSLTEDDWKGTTIYTFIDAANREVTISWRWSKESCLYRSRYIKTFFYFGVLSLLAGAEDIDRNVANANPFKDASRPYFDVNVNTFSALPSCSKGGP